MDTQIVKFLRDWNAYPKGSRAGFPKETADELVKAEIAEKVKADTKETKPATGAVTKGTATKTEE
ncbi:hypothetical protein LCM08_06215 [Salipiger pacificus]|nr:hypothetical protein [Alloyangia pacifica]